MSETLPITINIDFEKAAQYSKSELQKIIMDLEEVMKKAPQQIEIPLVHYHANAQSDDGIYGREIKIPKGTLLVGKIHRLQCINVLSSGEVYVLSIDGVMRFKAPHTFVSSPGAKRVIYAIEESTWTTFHATGETDPEKIEDKFILKNFSELGSKDAPRLEEKCHSSQ